MSQIIVDGKKLDAEHYEDAIDEKQHNENFQAIVAEDAAKAEKEMPLFKAIKMYPKACAWSVLMSTCLVMEGYDLMLLGNFYGMQQFTKVFGFLINDGSGKYTISAPWQSALSNAANIGEFFGLLLTGVLSDRIGYRYTIMLALFVIIGLLFMPFFSRSLWVLFWGEVLLGIPWGVFQTLTTAYASEVCPVALRFYLTTYVNLCWVWGQLIAAGILRGTVDIESEYAWRLPFAIQWAWPVPLMIVAFCAPESPWHLVRKGRYEDAKKSVARLMSKSMATEEYLEGQVQMMIKTNDLEKSMDAGMSYLDCFKGVNLRRTEIAAVGWVCQCMCTSFNAQSTYFLEQAGMAQSNAFNMNIVNYCLGAAGTILSWFVMQKSGRRPMYLGGLGIIAVLYFAVGFAGISNNTTPVGWATGALMIVITFCYDLTIGPVAYSVAAEISTTRLRSKTMVLARASYLVVNIVIAVIVPYMINTTAWNWKGKAGFFWGVAVAIMFVWSYFRLPEPKGRTYAELDVLFAKKISARKFKHTEVDPFESHTIIENDAEAAQLARLREMV